ncbi:MAG: hypothetical protein GOV00_02145 [Candidatus Altiarchaeota archaeon]|nr:hypothetical protein [Candidatus Altiarchaeota archaeon]
MTNIFVIVGLIVAGWFIGFMYEQFIGWASSIKLSKFESLGHQPNLANFLAETFYFAALFSVPLSGNIPLTGIMLSLFLYALFGKFGGVPKGKALKGEDVVITKWHKMFP